MCVVNYLGVEKNGGVPNGFGIGGGDYIELDICLQCGTVQGEFPLPDPEEFIIAHIEPYDEE